MAEEINNTLQTEAPIGLFRRLSRMFKTPGDILLTIRIGLFVFRLPRATQKSDLPSLLKKFRQASGPLAVDLDTGVARIARLRQPWFRLPYLGTRNTCYVRALTLYRFLNIPGSSIKIHFGVEPPRIPGEHTRGHAWVTANGKMLEPPDPVVSGRVKELYVYPQP